MIRTRLAEAFPDDGLLGEERGGGVESSIRSTTLRPAALAAGLQRGLLFRLRIRSRDFCITSSTIRICLASAAPTAAADSPCIMPIRQFYKCPIRNKASETAGTAKVGTKSKISIKQNRSYFVKILTNLTKIKLLKNSSESANKLFKLATDNWLTRSGLRLIITKDYRQSSTA